MVWFKKMPDNSKRRQKFFPANVTFVTLKIPRTARRFLRLAGRLLNNAGRFLRESSPCKKLHAFFRDPRSLGPGLKRAGVLLVLGALFCCASCTKDEAPQSPEVIKVGITIYRGDDTFIASMVRHFEQIAGQFSEERDVVLSITVEDAKRNQTSQNKQVENFLSRGYDVICVNPVDRTMANFIINMAEKADTPVIFFNREPVESDMELWNKVYYVGADARESADMMGQIVVEAFQKDPGLDKNQDQRLQYVMLEGEPTHQDSLIRTEESIKTITGSGIVLEKLASDTGEWQRDIATAKMTPWLGEFGEQIEVVLSNNDDMALGAIDALREEGMLENSPLVVGIDGTDVALEAIVQGTLYGSVVNDAYGQAKNVLELAYWLAQGKDPAGEIPALSNKHIVVPYYIVTGENVKEEIEMRRQLEFDGE